MIPGWSLPGRRSVGPSSPSEPELGEGWGSGMRLSVSTEFLQFLPQELSPADPRSQGQGEGLGQTLKCVLDRA